MGVQICTRALWPCSERPRDEPRRAPLRPGRAAPSVPDRQHQRCQGEDVAPQLKVLPSRTLSRCESGCQTETGSRSRPAPREEGSAPPLPTRGGDAPVLCGIRNWKAKR